jgi:hypothetical protein
MTMVRLSRGGLAVALALATTSCVAADWMQFGYDAVHSSNNPAETILTAGNVASVVLLYSQALPDNLDGAPVYLSNVATAGGNKNLLFAVSHAGTAMAINAADGSIVWSKSPGPVSVLNASPVIDPNRQYVYMAMPDGKIHKYAVADGTETIDANWPEVSTVKPTMERHNGSLSIGTYNGTSYLYAIASAYTDYGDYQGHLTTINLSTGAQVVFNSMCSNLPGHIAGPSGDPCASTGSSVWGRGGAVFDAARGRVYISTGNGAYDASSGGNNWGDSLISLAPDGTPATPGVPYDSYTPPNFETLAQQDLDLGAMSVALLPVPAASTIRHLGMQSGKDEVLRLINLDDMSGAGGPRHTGGELQSIPPASEWEYGGHEQSAVWVNPADGTTWLIFASYRTGLHAYTLGLSGQMPQLTPVWRHSQGVGLGTTSPVIANGVLYHVGTADGASVNSLMARDPVTGNVLWNSAPLSGIHWQSPIVVDGVIYVSDVEGGTAYLKAYGITGSHTTHVVTPVAGTHGSIVPGTPQTVSDGATPSFTVNPDSGYLIAAVSGCGGTLTGNVFMTAPVTADCTVTASFAAAPPVTHTVTPTASSGGSISPDDPQTVQDGDTVAFTVTPDVGFDLTNVTGCGGSLVDFVYTTAPVTADCTVFAAFTQHGDDTIFENGFDPN